MTCVKSLHKSVVVRERTGEMVSGAETCMFGVDWRLEMGKHNLFEDGDRSIQQWRAPIVEIRLG